MSPAAVCGAVRYLTQIGLLTRAREPGARRDHYELGDDVWYESFTRRDQLLARWEHRLADGERDLGPDTPAGRRLAETRAFFAFLREEMPAMLERWRERRRELDQS